MNYVMEKFLKKLIIYSIIAIAVYLGAVVATSYIKGSDSLFDTEYLTDIITVFITGMLLGVVFLFKLFALADGKGKKKKSFIKTF
mgnify:CR=1 FL=1